MFGCDKERTYCSWVFPYVCPHSHPKAFILTKLLFSVCSRLAAGIKARNSEGSVCIDRCHSHLGILGAGFVEYSPEAEGASGQKCQSVSITEKDSRKKARPGK